MNLVQPRLGRFGFGADYNPEQWPEDVWPEDIELMKRAGVSMVTLGIFSWANVEPRPGEYDFGWFDRAMDLLAGADIGVCLATMTASPPPWLARLHPGTLPERADGTVLWPGARQHFCPSSPAYREHAGRLVRQLVTRYREHPALALWHIGNEYGCHVPMCYCATSAEAFRTWLNERYGSVEALNEAWSTAFWSQRYSDFAEVFPPRTAPTFPNPAQQLDFRRFSSDALLECFLMEKEIIRELTPAVPVTTNFVGAWHRVDNAAWAGHQDVISYDSYPDPHDEHSHIEAAFTYDLMRSLGGGKPWLLLEQAPSAVNWRPRNAAKAPGQMRLWSHQAVARGADAVMFFQWRQSQGGAERFHSAMVSHGGADNRVFREVAELGAELAGLGGVLGSGMEAETALLMDWPNGWALESNAHPVADLTLREANLSHYRPLWEAGVSADVVPPSADLSRYRLLVVPNLYLVETEVAERLVEYVRGGGQLVMSFFSGIVDGCDRVHLGGYPAPFRELLGLTVEEFCPLPEGGTIGLSGGSGTIWSEWINTEGAEVLQTFAEGELAGRPAVTRHRFGDGVAYYLGTRPDPASMAAILAMACEAAGVEPALPGAPAGVEATVRHSADGTRWLFLLNHNDFELTVRTPSGEVPLAARDVHISPATS
ncbi:beta-galactosidase [Amycolatopsis nigrescens]|uniref:beta-galactosidase n=1 Tax=Amycolatopsis nigrescens TaxID=381445 RepID=UPI000371F211|nr:beta-galactosidase [Amycolatopsis nigrescens]